MRNIVRRAFDAVARRLAYRIARALSLPPEEMIQGISCRLDQLAGMRDQMDRLAEMREQIDHLSRLAAETQDRDAAAAGLLHGISQQLQHVLGGQAMDRYHARSTLDRGLLLQGRTAALKVQERERIHHLGDVEFRVTSQWGEDGIIEWLCHKLPGIPRSFVEFGVENYGESNTRFLLQNRGWKGLVIDGNQGYMDALRTDELYWRYDITAVGAFVTAENINGLIGDYGFAGDLGILSVDIDGTDYWVLKSIDAVQPAIIICEINGVFGDLKALTVPYRPDFDRLSAHYSGQYFGCSVRAVERLCRERGYSFVGTNTGGVNAFFVRNDLAKPVLDSISEIRAWPQRHRDSRDTAGRQDFARGQDKLLLIRDMPAVDLDTGKVVPIRQLYPLYSEKFLEDFA
jgi:hypothetical protein